MTTIKPLFPDQQSINEAVEKLSPESRATYDELMRLYQIETEKANPDRTRISTLISEAQELLNR